VIDLAAETLLTLEKAAEKLEVSKATLHRWITYGTKGVRLEAAKLGGRWRTSEEAIQRFSDRLTPNRASTISQPTPTPTPRQRQRQLEQVKRELDELWGIRRCETCEVVVKPPKGASVKGERLWCPKCLTQRKSATIGKRIRTFRWASSLSLQSLSQRTGISVTNLRAYEFDEKEPSESHLAKLIEHLGQEMVSGWSGSKSSPIS